MFGIAKMETGDGEDACRGCDLLPTKNGSGAFAEDDELFNEVAECIAESNAGFEPEFENLETRRLFIFWRSVEKQIEFIWNVRQQAWLKAQFEK